MSRRDLCGGLSGVMLLASGCLVEDTPYEESGATVSVGGKQVFIRFYPQAWPGGSDADGSVEIISDDGGWFSDGTRVSMEGDRFALPSSSDEWGGDIGQIELDVDGNTYFTTDWAIALFHRPDDGRRAWEPVDCGVLSSSERMRREDLEYYDPDSILIDLAYGELQVAPPDGSPRTVSFDDCDIVERYPEFAAFPFPMWNLGNMEDKYTYQLDASCDGRECPEYSRDPSGGDCYGSSRTRTDRTSTDRYDRYDRSRTTSRTGSGTRCSSGSRTSDRYATDGSSRTGSRRTSGGSNLDAARWSATGESFTFGADRSTCDEVQIDETGRADDVRISLTGEMPRRGDVRITLAHGDAGQTRTVAIPISDVLTNTEDRLEARNMEVSGFSGDAEGKWLLCVQISDGDRSERGTIESWSVSGY